MPEHVRCNHVLRCHRQDVKADAFGMRSCELVKARGKCRQVLSGFRFQLGLIIAFDDVPETQPLDQIVGDRRVATKITGRIATIIGQCLFQNLPAIFGLSPGETKGHVRVGSAINMWHTQGVTFNRRLPAV